MYDWDIEKNKLNTKIHGISFEDAVKHIFESSNIIVNEVAYNKREVRHAIIGLFKEKYYTGIFTIRNNKIRIISVRRARYEEIEKAKEKGLW